MYLMSQALQLSISVWQMHVWWEHAASTESMYLQHEWHSWTNNKTPNPRLKEWFLLSRQQFSSHKKCQTLMPKCHKLDLPKFCFISWNLKVVLCDFYKTMFFFEVDSSVKVAVCIYTTNYKDQDILPGTCRISILVCLCVFFLHIYWVNIIQNGTQH